MMTEDDWPIMIYTTFANAEDARNIGEKLVVEELAACVNILAGMTSIYRWQGEIRNDEEVVMLVKSRASVKSALTERLKLLHPYETPVIFVINGEAYGRDYWQWLCSQTGT